MRLNYGLCVLNKSVSVDTMGIQTWGGVKLVLIMAGPFAHAQIFPQHPF